MFKQRALIGAVALVVLGVFFAAASEKAFQASLEEILSIGGENDDVLFQWVSIATDPDGNMYVTDLKDFSLKKFDKQGRLVKKTGKLGQGPGDFQSPGLVRFFKGKIFVSEIQHMGIHIFDPDLKFLEKIPVSTPVSDFRIIGDDRLAVSTLNDTRVLLFDFKGAAAGAVPYAGTKELMLNTIDFVKDGEFYYAAFMWQDKIIKIDATGKKIWERNLLKQGKVRMRDVAGFKLPKDITYKSLTIGPNHDLLVLGGVLSKNSSRDVYVITPEGKLRGILTLPEPSHSIYLDSAGCLYTSTAFGTGIKKFKLSYHE